MTDCSKIIDHPFQHLSFPLFQSRLIGTSFVKNAFKIAVCALTLFLLCPCSWAGTHFGIGVDTGDQKVSWVGSERAKDEQSLGRMNFTVTENNQEEKADRWNPNYDTDIDYGAYIKSFKLLLIIKKAF
jgi:hypothetical protein